MNRTMHETEILIIEDSFFYNLSLKQISFNAWSYHYLNIETVAMVTVVIRSV